MPVIPLRMEMGARRALTGAERRALSPGLVAALDAAGVEPVIVARASALAWVAGLWRSQTPVLTLPGRIHWPGALTDFSEHEDHLAVLQHELQHVLDYASGALSLIGYALKPSNWRYAYELAPGLEWRHFGAEQRAMLAEDLLRLERAGLAHSGKALRLAELIPWHSVAGEQA